MYERFEQLLKENNVTPYRVSKETGIPTATLSSWKKGTYTPKNDKLQLIADYFNVSLEWLIGNTDLREKIPTEGYYDDPEVAKLANEIKNDPELRLLLDAKRSLSKEDMESVINITKSLLRKERGFED
ncbi:helix-turn-helix domain-containing protein [Veillonella ratti]|uniref:helix-turn-helix domain-containing protein n=1 Tax=Veillonella ratti TaxID=103892 RepID=UPI000F8E54AF|nr:helix-turn-helix transcriptional regulator [Veillonella ratti]